MWMGPGHTYSYPFIHQIFVEYLLCARDCGRYWRLMGEVEISTLILAEERKYANHVISKYIIYFVRSDICYRKGRKCKGE